MIDKSEREKQAIRDARQNFAEALERFGLMEPFFHRSAGEIDAIIEACVSGYQASLFRQAANRDPGDPNDDLPF